MPSHEKIKRACKPPHSDSANSNDTATNVNSFGQSVCELQTAVLRGQSRPAYNNQDFMWSERPNMKSMLHETSAVRWPTMDIGYGFY